MAAKDKLPGFSEKRAILFSKRTSPQKMRETGVKFMEAELYDDALEFFARCDARDLVHGIAQKALERGDTPLYMRAKKVLKEQIREDEWDALARNALKAGCPSKAYMAKLKAGKKDEAEELRARVEGETGSAAAQGPDEADKGES